MPFRRRTRRRRYSIKSRAHAASTISKAWKRRRRSKTGLVSRTAQANRRAVKRLSKSVETKLIQDTQATPANQFSGQFSDNITVDNRGVDTGSAQVFFADLLSGLAQGAGTQERVGAWIQLTSLTLKYYLTGITDCPAHFTLMLVHDQRPAVQGSLADVLDFTGAAPFVPNAYDMAFQNMSNVGKDGRFKILWKKVHKLSDSSSWNNVDVVPAITQAPSGSVMRPQYTAREWQQQDKQYPSYLTGSVTLRLPYKINYGMANASIQPFNQTLRLLAFCTAPPGLPQPDVRMGYYTRVRYKDA